MSNQSVSSDSTASRGLAHGMPPWPTRPLPMPHPSGPVVQANPSLCILPPLPITPLPARTFPRPLPLMAKFGETSLATLPMAYAHSLSQIAVLRCMGTLAPRFDQDGEMVLDEPWRELRDGMNPELRGGDNGLGQEGVYNGVAGPSAMPGAGGVPTVHNNVLPANAYGNVLHNATSGPSVHNTVLFNTAPVPNVYNNMIYNNMLHHNMLSNAAAVPGLHNNLHNDLHNNFHNNLRNAPIYNNVNTFPFPFPNMHPIHNVPSGYAHMNADPALGTPNLPAAPATPNLAVPANPYLFAGQAILTSPTNPIPAMPANPTTRNPAIPATSNPTTPKRQQPTPKRKRTTPKSRLQALAAPSQAIMFTPPAPMMTFAAPKHYPHFAEATVLPTPKRKEVKFATPEPDFMIVPNSHPMLHQKPAKPKPDTELSPLPPIPHAHPHFLTVPPPKGQYDPHMYLRRRVGSMVTLMRMEEVHKLADGGEIHDDGVQVYLRRRVGSVVAVTPLEEEDAAGERETTLHDEGDGKGMYLRRRVGDAIETVAVEEVSPAFEGQDHIEREHRPMMSWLTPARMVTLPDAYFTAPREEGKENEGKENEGKENKKTTVAKPKTANKKTINDKAGKKTSSTQAHAPERGVFFKSAKLPKPGKGTRRMPSGWTKPSILADAGENPFVRETSLGE